MNHNLEPLKSALLTLKNCSHLQFQEHFEDLNFILKALYNEETFKPLSLKTILTELNILITFCRENDIKNYKILKAILQIWCGEEDNDIDGVIGDVCATIYFNDENIKFLCQALKDYTSPVAILDLHISTRHGNGMIFGFVAERVLNAFNISHLSEAEYNHLLSTAENSIRSNEFDPRKLLMGLNEEMVSASDVIEYLELKKKELKDSEVVPKPNYVSLKEDETEEMYKSFRIKDSIESKDLHSENPELESKGSLDSDETPESIKAMLDKIVKIKPQKVEAGQEAPLTVDEAIDIYMTTKLNESLISNEKSESEPSQEPKVLYQRYYGPVNTNPDFNCLSLPLKEFSGNKIPCCMFYCICKTFTFEDPEVQETQDYTSLAQDWFTGHCDYCEKTIEKFRYAVRFPLAHGCWEGCYCSYDCLYKSKHFPIYKSDDLRIKEIIYYLKKHGVADF
jgi:hypothetical protein